LLRSGKEKVVAPSSAPSDAGKPHKQLGDKAKMSESKKAEAGSRVFTEPQSRIRIV